ncbi:MAG: glycosyltransferase [Thermoguttaceae bacterium]
MAEHHDRVAVVIATRDRRPELLRTLGHLSALPERPPIIVVDNASGDGAPEAVTEAFPSVRVVRADRNLGAAARNLGIQATDAAYIAFCDDDTWWVPGSLDHAAAVLDSFSQLALVMARVLIGPEDLEDPICKEIWNSPLPRPPDIPGAPLVGFLAGASVIRRSAFLEVGGFRAETGIGGEEDWLAADLLSKGWRMTYLPQLGIHHWPSSLRDPRRRAQHVLANALAFAWLRRPTTAALRTTWRLWRQSPSTIGALRASGSAAIRIIRHWHDRRIVPPDVERNYRLLETWDKKLLPRTVEEDAHAFRPTSQRQSASREDDLLDVR